MSKRKTFTDKLKAFIFGPPIPILSEHDLAIIHQLDHKLTTLLPRLPEQPADQNGRQAQNYAEPNSDVATEVRKLAKVQFKANTLQEAQLAQQQVTLAALQQSLTQQEQRQVELSRRQQQALEQAQLELCQSLFPVLDSLDAAFDTGRRQVLKLAMPAETRQAIIAWLDGIRLSRLRLLAVLQSHNIRPIPTIGQPFDPNRHIATATQSGGQAVDGVIIAEDRRGYATPDKVLRYAEVVVAQAN